MVRVCEGAVEFEAASCQGPRGPGSKETGFYNRAMVYSRDASVSVFSAVRGGIRSPSPRVLDGLCGTGVRGLRIAKEAGPVELHLNDIDPETCRLAKANAEANGVDASVTCVPFYKAVADGPFDYVDVDPYGTPSPFLASLIPSIRRKALLGICATDTATLVGKHRAALRRRYMVAGAFPEPDHEAGLRAMLGWIARTCAMSDVGFRPLVSYHRDHHYRCFAMLEQGATRGDKALADTGMLSRGRFGYRFDRLGEFGPVWTAPVGDPDFARSLGTTGFMECGPELASDAQMWAEEWGVGAFHSDSALLSSKLRMPMPPAARLIGQFRSAGFKAARSSLSRDGFVADATEDEIEKIFLLASRGVGNH